MSTQRLKWLGHALRLLEDSPARQALRVIETPNKKVRGRPKTRWIDTVVSQLKLLHISYEQAKNIAINRIEWNKVVREWKRQIQNVDRINETVT